jgi:carbon-monoxide dehydrogenase small subunit
MGKHHVSMTVNETEHEIEVDANTTLLRLLHDALFLPGTKDGCSQGVCGACTVLVDGKAVRACLTLAVRLSGKQVTTVEGLKVDGALHAIQQAFVDEGSVQCGFCTPGMLMSSVALLEENPRPTEGDVREALVGNLCRCTGYVRIVRAVLAASRMRLGHGPRGGRRPPAGHERPHA